jgi:acetyl-CoA acetyltransferase
VITQGQSKLGAGFAGKAVISGIGQSEIGRRLFRPAINLTLDAALHAIADAGLELADIDGLAAYPGGDSVPLGAPSLPPGFRGPSLLEVHDALRLRLSWYTSGSEVTAQLAPVVAAVAAIATGLANHVLVYRTVTEGSERAKAKEQATGSNGQRRTTTDIDGPMQWLAPYGVVSPPQWYAFYLRRYMHDFGLTREQLAQLPISARTKSALNPKAIYRDALTVEAYLASRMISDPLCLFDCDVPCDGSTAFVISRAEYAAESPHDAVRIESAGTGAGPRMYRDQSRDVWFGQHAATQMWSHTDLRPSDVNVAQLYDGFTLITVSWLEALGFCGRGEAGDFLEGGKRIALDGELPLNTSGGQLAAGRLHGLGLLHEACLQLRGDAGDRQVADAEVAVVANGGLPNMSCLLLTRAR